MLLYPPPPPNDHTNVDICFHFYYLDFIKGSCFCCQTAWYLRAVCYQNLHLSAVRLSNACCYIPRGNCQNIIFMLSNCISLSLYLSNCHISTLKSAKMTTASFQTWPKTAHFCCQNCQSYISVVKTDRHWSRTVTILQSKQSPLSKHHLSTCGDLFFCQALAFLLSNHHISAVKTDLHFC